MGREEIGAGEAMVALVPPRPKRKGPLEAAFIVVPCSPLRGDAGLGGLAIAEEAKPREAREHHRPS